MTEEQLDKNTDIILKTMMKVISAGRTEEHRETVLVFVEMLNTMCENFVEKYGEKEAS